MQVEDKVKRVFKELFSIELCNFSEDLDVNSVIGWDSMNHLNLIMALEESLNVSFTTDEAVRMTSVRNILEILRSKNV